MIVIRAATTSGTSLVSREMVSIGRKAVMGITYQSMPGRMYQLLYRTRMDEDNTNGYESYAYAIRICSDPYANRTSNVEIERVNLNFLIA
jgi:hypothetical protein